MNAPFADDPTLLAGAPSPPPFAWIGELGAFLRRNRSLLAGCVIGAVCLAVLYLLVATPRYAASATLLIDKRQTDLFRQHPVVSDAQIESAMIESEVEVLRSPGLARKVVARLDLANDPAFSPPPSLLSRLMAHLHTAVAGPQDAAAASMAREDRLAQQLLSMIVPHRIGLTYVIEIDATAASPEMAAKLANGVADAYVAGQIADRTSANRQASGWMEDRLAEARNRALKADQAVQAYKARTGIVDTGHGTLDDQQLAELNSQLVAAQGKSASAQARLDRIREAVNGNGTAVVEALNSPVINGLRERYLTDAQHLAEWSARYGKDHFAAVTMRKEMATLQASIDSEMRRIEKTAESDLEVARASQAALQARLDALVGRSASSNMDRATLRSLQSAADSYQTLYGAFLQRAAQSTQDESFPVADARVITVAHPPLTKSKPQGKLVLVAAIVLGLGAGFAASVLREALDRRFRGPTDLTNQTGLACLATLPSVRPSPGAQSAGGDPLFDQGIRRLQLRVQPPAKAARGRVVGIVAPEPGSGTSTIAGHLVGALEGAGFSARLLDVSGRSDPTAATRSALETLRREADVVVVDFPALSEPALAHAVFDEVTALVLVAVAGRHGGAAVAESLRAAGLERRMIFGAVLNRSAAGGR